jgi:hypothetical protein
MTLSCFSIDLTTKLIKEKRIAVEELTQSLHPAAKERFFVPQ